MKVSGICPTKIFPFDGKSSFLLTNVALIVDASSLFATFDVMWLHASVACSAVANIIVALPKMERSPKGKGVFVAW